MFSNIKLSLHHYKGNVIANNMIVVSSILVNEICLIITTCV